ncbi:DUF3108 domain-containing protein [Massilia sp. Se16.2.3]|nr:DUF3108 domain-containing protein [Massilia sp. Se16.2.3]
MLGEFESEGGEDDAGMAPASTRERSPTGGAWVTRFNREENRIDYAGGAAPPPGVQDRASVLIQLAGMGLAEPDQMQDVIEIVVGGAAGTGIARFRVMGQEEIDTGIGRLAAVHLAQLAPSGERRVELWLAPQQHWLPVRIR